VAPTVAGRLELVRLHLPVSTNVTNVCLGLGVVGSTLTSGQNFAGLWTAAGARVGVTADQASNWGSGTGIKAMALAGGPFSCASGDDYVGFWYNGTPSPSWLRWSGAGGAFFNAGLSAPNFRVCSADTGLTTTGPATLGAQTSASISWWAGLS
jgi:hypothetical protein